MNSRVNGFLSNLLAEGCVDLLNRSKLLDGRLASRSNYIGTCFGSIIISPPPQENPPFDERYIFLYIIWLMKHEPA